MQAPIRTHLDALVRWPAWYQSLLKRLSLWNWIYSVGYHHSSGNGEIFIFKIAVCFQLLHSPNGFEHMTGTRGCDDFHSFRKQASLLLTTTESHLSRAKNKIKKLLLFSQWWHTSLPNSPSGRLERKLQYSSPVLWTTCAVLITVTLRWDGNSMGINLIF